MKISCGRWVLPMLAFLLLRFANGHLDGIAGIATVDAGSADSLVYRAPIVDGKRCVVTFESAVDEFRAQGSGCARPLAR